MLLHKCQRHAHHNTSHARLAGISSAAAAHRCDSQSIDSPLYTLYKAPGTGAGRVPATAINRLPPAVEANAALPHLLLPAGQRRLELQQRSHCRAACAGRHSHASEQNASARAGGEGREGRRAATARVAAPSAAAPLAAAATPTSLGSPPSTMHAASRAASSRRRHRHGGARRRRWHTAMLLPEA